MKVYETFCANVTVADFWVAQAFDHVDFESPNEIFGKRLLNGAQSNKCLFDDKTC